VDGGPGTGPVQVSRRSDTDSGSATHRALHDLHAHLTALADVKSPVIQIEAQGSLVAPRVEMQMKVARTGSGFIIGDSGIAPA